MEKEQRKAHCLVLPMPAQGHINPILQFSKRLQNRGVKITLVTTRFLAKKSPPPSSSNSIPIVTISDGYDDMGLQSTKEYLDSFWDVGPKTLSDLLHRLNSPGSSSVVDCIIYDALLPWGLDVARKFGIKGVAFSTQSFAVAQIYYHVHLGLIKLPVDPDSNISLPGLPPFGYQDLPTFMYRVGSYPEFFDMHVDQFCSFGDADGIFFNSFYELEKEVADWFGKIWPLRAIGPCIPSFYLDKRLENDKEYGFNLFSPSDDSYMNWLNEKPKDSVVYVSFGSTVGVDSEQMEEVAMGLSGLRGSNIFFLWVVRSSEVSKLVRLKSFGVENCEEGLVISWCSQLEVLAHEAIGCFVTHGGWNSCLESLSLGVPMVVIPQLTDQSSNAKLVSDVWEMGMKPEVDGGEIVRHEVLEHCIREVMEGEKGKEMRGKAREWKELANGCLDEGGSSDKNIDEFVNSLIG